MHGQTAAPKPRCQNFLDAEGVLAGMKEQLNRKILALGAVHHEGLHGGCWVHSLRKTTVSTALNTHVGIGSVLYALGIFLMELRSYLQVCTETAPLE